MKFRILKNKFGRYEVERKSWFFGIWVSDFSAGWDGDSIRQFEKLEEAETAIKEFVEEKKHLPAEVIKEIRAG
jgi:hypothetical protein